MKHVNVPILIASLFASISLWLYVFAQNAKPMTPVWYSVRLESTNLDSTKWVVTKIDDLIRFSAIGTEDEIQRLKNKDLAAFVDLSQAHAGTRPYPVLVLPEDIKDFITQKELYTKVTIEPLATKSLAVTVMGEGSLHDPKMVLSDTQVLPSTVTLSGPKSLVDRAVVARARFDLGKVTASAKTTYTVDLDVLDKDRHPLDPALVHTDPIFVQIRPILGTSPEERSVYVFPQIVGDPAAGFVSVGSTPEPAQVTVRGPSLTIARYGRVLTEPIDISGLVRSHTYRVKLALPVGLTVAPGLDQVTVHVEVKRGSGNGPPSDQVNPPN